MAVKLSALRTGRVLLPQKIISFLQVLISVRGCANLGDRVGPEGVGKLKQFINLIGSRIRDLLACSIVP
jgi:hypothetical protein